MSKIIHKFVRDVEKYGILTPTKENPFNLSASKKYDENDSSDDEIFRDDVAKTHYGIQEFTDEDYLTTYRERLV